MVQERDAEQVGSLPESAGEDAILLAGGGIAGGVIVLCGVASYVKFLQTDASAPA